jgi:NADH:ubiquinone oxidoreductase subunit H
MRNFPRGLLIIIIFWCWFVSILAETNRAPFDFAEGESELVSGFNVEFQGGLFALLFLGEYSVIIFISIATSI